MIKVHYPDRIHGLDEYETLMRLKKAEKEDEKRYRKDENGKNRQK